MNRFRALCMAGCAMLVALASAQQDPPQWNPATAYIGGGLVRGSDGNFYRATHNSTNHNPTTDDDSYWELYYVRSSINLTVAASHATFTSLQRAWNFVASATIAGPAKVLIHINTSYGNFSESFPSTLNLNHPFGAAITITGDDPTKIILRFPSKYTGILLTDGHCLGGISSVTIDGTEAQKAGATGIYVQSRSYLGFSSKLIIRDFDNGIGAEMQSTVNCSQCTVAAWNWGFYAFTGSHMTAQSCNLSNQSYGFWADGNSFMNCMNSKCVGGGNAAFAATGGSVMTAGGASATNANNGFLSSDRSELMAWYSTSKNNSVGYHAFGMAHLEANGNTIGSNGTDYVPALNTVGADNSLVSH